MRPYYSDDAVTIYHGDCREVEALEFQADAVIADPPYNVGITYGAGTNDNREDYEEWTRNYGRPVAL
jgi:DNA modification methylase